MMRTFQTRPMRTSPADRPSGRRTHRLTMSVVIGGLILVGCGQTQTVVTEDAPANESPIVVQAETGPKMDLDDVSAACAGSTEGPGIAVIDRDLQDANITVELPDCVLHLEQGAGIQLNNVVITGGILNIHDRDTDPSVNRIKLQSVEIEVDALLVELNDVDDSLQIEATDIVTAQGVGLRVAGTHDGANEGGDIRLVGSSLLSTDLDATIHILASEHSGTVRLINTTVDTRGALTVLAADCEARLDGDLLDCSAATLEAELGS